MIDYIINTFKKFFGLNVNQSRKRSFRETCDDFELEVSTDDEIENSSVKRRKIVSDSMADWVTTRQHLKFSEKYYTSTRKPQQHDEDVVYIEPTLDPPAYLIKMQRELGGLQRAKEVPAISEWNVLKTSGKYLPSRPNSENTATGMSHQSRGKKRSVRNGDSRYMDSAAFTNRTGINLVKNNARTTFSKASENTPKLLTRPFHESCKHECSVHPKSSEKSSLAGLTVNHCIRLEEKEKYRQLLTYFSSSQPSPIPMAESLNLQRSFMSMKSNNHHPVNTPFTETKKPISQNNWLAKGKLSSVEQKRYKEQILNSSTKVASISRIKPEESEVEIIGSVSQKNVPARGTDRPNITEPEVPKWKKMLTKNVDYPYNSKWLDEWRRQLAVDRQEKARQIEQAEKLAKKVKPPWEDTFDKLEATIREQLSLAEKQSEIIEEVFTAKEDLDKTEEEEEEPLPELTAEMDEEIDDALVPNPPDQVLVEAFRLQIRRRDMETLQDLNWLNDEIINFYMNLLMERGKQSNMPSVYACNTFFYPKLLNGGHVALKRWTRKIDVFAHDIMLVPIHLGVHWCLAVIDFRKKTIKYYDSMAGQNNECLNALCNYLQAESLDKKKKEFDMKDWSLENVKDAPHQMNSSDCGMFACKYAEYITRNAKVTLKQNQMPYFRRRMVYEILKAKLL